MKKLVLVGLLALFCAACESGVKENVAIGDLAVPVGEKIAVAIGSVFGTDPVGSVSAISLGDSKEVVPNLGITDASDARARASGNYLFVINGFGTDTIQVFDIRDKFTMVANYSVGNGSNPQDIVIAGDKAYVSRMNANFDVEDANDILVIDPLNGNKITSIDLKGYMTSDGEQLAFAGKMLLIGKTLYVICQDLSSWYVADTNGKVVIIDTETDTVLDKIDLVGRNPWDMAYLKNTGKIYVNNTGVFDPITYLADPASEFGGIEVIDVATNKSEGIKVDDLDLGGSLSEIRVTSANVGYVLVSSTTLASFDPTTYQVLNKNLYTSTSKEMYVYIPDMEIMDNGQILVAERDPTNSGIVVLNPDGSVANGPIGIGAPPASVEIVEVK